jgi:hypothetical protein
MKKEKKEGLFGLGHVHIIHQNVSTQSRRIDFAPPVHVLSLFRNGDNIAQHCENVVAYPKILQRLLDLSFVYQENAVSRNR